MCWRSYLLSYFASSTFPRIIARKHLWKADVDPWNHRESSRRCRGDPSAAHIDSKSRKFVQHVIVPEVMTDLWSSLGNAGVILELDWSLGVASGQYLGKISWYYDLAVIVHTFSSKTKNKKNDNIHVALADFLPFIWTPWAKFDPNVKNLGNSKRQVFVRIMDII